MICCIIHPDLLKTFLLSIFHHMKTLSPKTIFYLFQFSLFVKYKYHAKIDDQIDKALASMTQGLINKLVSVLEATLGKLSRYDEGSFIGSFLKITVSFADFSKKKFH